MDGELVVRGGTVVDGTGAPGRRADVAITGGRITAIGDGLRGDRELDADGHVVAPGFVDIHTHYDAQVFWDPALTPSCFHGVTTVVAGNCGFSIAPVRPEHRSLIARTLQHVEDMSLDALAAGVPWDFETFPQYLEAVEQRGVALNYGAYVGHTAVRLFAMGDAGYERTATDDEIARMRAIVRESIDAGAMGFASSTSPTHNGDGGRPVPSRIASREELVALAKVVAEAGRGVVEITPGELVPHPEIVDFAREVGAPVTWTALLTIKGYPYHERVVEKHHAAQADGVRVWPQVSCRPLVFQMTLEEPFNFGVVPMFAELLALSLDEKIARYADPRWRALAQEALDSGRFLRPNWHNYSVAETTTKPGLVGRPLDELAAEWGVRPLDVMADVAVPERLATRFTSVLANDDPDGIEWLLQQPGMLIGLADSGAHVGQLCDACFTTDFLGTWVRDKDLMPIEQAVHRLTAEPAAAFGLADRGVLAPGRAADVVVFDPATVGPGPLRRVRDFPAGAERLTADAPTGITHVLVNGTPIRVDGTPSEAGLAARPGRVLRG